MEMSNQISVFNVLIKQGIYFFHMKKITKITQVKPNKYV